jgi:hypothetical protein
MPIAIESTAGGERLLVTAGMSAKVNPRRTKPEPVVSEGWNLGFAALTR